MHLVRVASSDVHASKRHKLHIQGAVVVGRYS